MTFVSYAQNFEDVMLWRALKQIKNGFYIDVGAQDPLVDSVTKAFYETGWHGINIEPIDQYFRRLKEQRPNDININAAVRSQPGHVVIHAIHDTGMSTTSNDIAEMHRSNGWSNIDEVLVPTVTLDEVCRKHGVETIHFLKIDVEGDEKKVLDGFSLAEFRPWILVIEATAPNSNTDVSAPWIHLVTEQGYKQVYFDGLNKFFVADEHAELASAFAFPPNPIDNFITLPVVIQTNEVYRLSGELTQAQDALTTSKNLQNETEERAKSLAEQLGALSTEHQACRSRLGTLTAEHQACRSRLEAIENSTSWKVIQRMALSWRRLARFFGL